VSARLTAQLEKTPYLMGSEFSAADLLLVSPYTWMPQATPDVKVIRDWIERCESRPSARQVQEFDKAHMPG
jgi:glutathione S-transferase